MQAIIFANRLGDELSPLNRHYCPALLPVGNKAVIEYTLEDISSAGITQVKLVISPQAREIEQHLGTGNKWGVDIEYFLSKPQEQTTSVLKRLSLDTEEKLLLARGDIFRSPSIGQFIEFSKAFPDNFVQAKMANQKAGMMLLPAALPHVANLNWPLAGQSCGEAVVTLVLHGHCCMLDSFQSYIDTNLSLAANQYPSLTPMERCYQSANPEQDFYVGAKAHTGQLNKQSGWGIIGANARIDPSVTLKNGVLVGSNCLIDRETTLNNSLVLPHTYVGENLEIRDSILSKNLLINVRSGATLEIDDQALIGSSQAGEIDSSNRTSLTTRSLLLILLMLSLPLWPLIQAFSFIKYFYRMERKSAKVLYKPIQASVITQSHRDNSGHAFQTWRWNISPKVLALLPQLRHVISGRLDLFGASPEVRHSQGLQNQRLGVLGPVQLLLDESSPEEERTLLALEFDADKRHGKYLSLLWRSLLIHDGQENQNEVDGASLNRRQSMSNR
ncbi:NDP-sugar synthase [uncultured Shewanella sp.]|uniref:NDP-sugar synthase n=1 Tax=uncultured Shewanella sp. TaxID=173975 RepID=UPI0026386A5B|nr:NDP-sugar synthase [uncultured Shewanella sp.]